MEKNQTMSILKKNNNKIKQKNCKKSNKKFLKYLTYKIYYKQTFTNKYFNL